MHLWVFLRAKRVYTWGISVTVLLTFVHVNTQAFPYSNRRPVKGQKPEGVKAAIVAVMMVLPMMTTIITPLCAINPQLLPLKTLFIMQKAVITLKLLSPGRYALLGRPDEAGVLKIEHNARVTIREIRVCVNINVGTLSLFHSLRVTLDFLAHFHGYELRLSLCGKSFGILKWSLHLMVPFPNDEGSILFCSTSGPQVSSVQARRNSK